MLFDIYLFADYSGAASASAQRKSIRLAQATRGAAPTVFEKRLTRDELVTEFVALLKDATRRGYRVCFGQDHQYGIPFSLAKELSLHSLPWRTLVASLCAGNYGKAAPQLGHPQQFGRAFNTWLVSRGAKPYFYSATKAASYGVPRTNPRPGDSSTYRLSERCRPISNRGNPKPFNRIGDRGSVGGQSLVGLVAIHRLLLACAKEGVPVAVWPFDGLAVTDEVYADRHVMIEPYPTAVRARTVRQSDAADALASAAKLRQLDADGDLVDSLDLTGLSTEEQTIVRIEGWILGHRPLLRRDYDTHH